MSEITEAERLLVEVFEKGRWEHSPLIDSVYVIPGELKDKITQYLQEHELIGVAG
jgi:hypothetical protein